MAGALNSSGQVQEQPSPLPLEANELLKAFESLTSKQDMPPEVGEFTKGVLELMRNAVSGKEKGDLSPEKGRMLFESFDAMMKKQEMSPEAADMFKSMRGLVKKAMPQPGKQETAPELKKK